MKSDKFLKVFITKRLKVLKTYCCVVKVHTFKDLYFLSYLCLFSFLGDLPLPKKSKKQGLGVFFSKELDYFALTNSSP